VANSRIEASTLATGHSRFKLGVDLINTSQEPRFSAISALGSRQDFCRISKYLPESWRGLRPQPNSWIRLKMALSAVKNLLRTTK
jgi:hypothetical protein